MHHRTDGNPLFTEQARRGCWPSRTRSPSRCGAWSPRGWPRCPRTPGWSSTSPRLGRRPRSARSARCRAAAGPGRSGAAPRPGTAGGPGGAGRPLFAHPLLREAIVAVQPIGGARAPGRGPGAVLEVAGPRRPRPRRTGRLPLAGRGRAQLLRGLRQRVLRPRGCTVHRGRRALRARARRPGRPRHGPHGPAPRPRGGPGPGGPAGDAAQAAHLVGDGGRAARPRGPGGRGVPRHPPRVPSVWVRKGSDLHQRRDAGGGGGGVRRGAGPPARRPARRDPGPGPDRSRPGAGVVEQVRRSRTSVPRQESRRPPRKSPGRPGGR